MDNKIAIHSEPIVVNTQYIRDFSFENPQAPAIFLKNEQPKVEIDLDINAKSIGDNVFEVILGIQAKASIENDVIFLVELQYAGVFTVNTTNEAEKEMLLLVNCPGIIFPYARRIISDITRDGGYPPLMIAPIDFLELYEKKRKHNDSSAGNVTIN
ncbi:protein-export chaperone SecB [Candidatus Lariskella endosymbiont of Hedychridium roseum]|uniref:protein-export chaperone SecB n=1 Tax=Candidatus Lariskella endosymbiont of Hedychridium roseum TaxID=3077949 RepID=UPI0030CAC9F4